MREPIDIADLRARLHELLPRLQDGERFVVMDRGRAVAALVSVAELNDLDETDAVLADEGLLEALRAARAASEEPSTYEP